MKKSTPAHINEEFSESIDQQLKILEHVSGYKPFVLEKSPGFQIAQAEARVRIAILRKFKENEYDVTPDQGVVLNAIHEKEGVSQREIADKTMKDKPTITHILDILERKKYIIRRPDDHDRRIYKIFLTDSGRTKIELFGKIIREVDEKAFKGLGAADKNRLQKILLKIRSNLEK